MHMSNHNGEATSTLYFWIKEKLTLLASRSAAISRGAAIQISESWIHAALIIIEMKSSLHSCLMKERLTEYVINKEQGRNEAESDRYYEPADVLESSENSWPLCGRSLHSAELGGSGVRPLEPLSFSACFGPRCFSLSASSCLA